MSVRRWSGRPARGRPAFPDSVPFGRLRRADGSDCGGRALRRPAIFPVPAIAIRTLYGEMSEIVTEGQRAVPARTLELGYRFSQPDLDAALASALGR